MNVNERSAAWAKAWALDAKRSVRTTKSIARAIDIVYSDLERKRKRVSILIGLLVGLLLIWTVAMVVLTANRSRIQAAELPPITLER